VVKGGEIKMVCYNKNMRKFPRNKDIRSDSFIKLLSLGVTPKELHNMSDFPQELIKPKGNFIYTDEMYKEDLYIANWVFRKEFSKSKLLQPLKDDLISVCISHLWGNRQKYDEMKGAKYHTFGYLLCFQKICRTIETKQWRFENGYNVPLDKEKTKFTSLGSLDETVGTDENGDKITLFDFNNNAAPETPLNENKDIKDTATRATHFEIVNTLSTDRKKQIIDLVLQGYKFGRNIKKMQVQSFLCD
jgi:hypothetical protein